MEQNLNKRQLQDVLRYVGISIPSRCSADGLRRIFSEHRSVVEDAVEKNPSIIAPDSEGKDDGNDATPTPSVATNLPQTLPPELWSTSVAACINSPIATDSHTSYSSPSYTATPTNDISHAALNLYRTSANVPITTDIYSTYVNYCPAVPTDEVDRAAPNLLTSSATAFTKPPMATNNNTTNAKSSYTTAQTDDTTYAATSVLIRPIAHPTDGVHTMNSPAVYVPMASMHHQCNETEEEQLDNEIKILQRRYEVLRLRKEIERMERNMGTDEANNPSIAKRAIHFQDIEHAIVKFSGEDRTYGIMEFFRNLEEVLVHVQADELLKFLTLRNSLTGSARLLLGRGALTYEDLKATLIKEFGRTVSRQEIYNSLRRRLKKPDESVRRYVMEMEAIAIRSDVSSFELVAFVQEGLQGRVSDFILFAAAKTMEEVKNAVDIHEQRQCVRGGNDSYANNNRASVSGEKTTTTKTDGEAVRCYNCSKMGHMKPQCPYEERPVGVCFNCWQAGHESKSCNNTKRVQRLKTSVAAISEENSTAEEGTNYVNILNKVCLRFMNLVILRLFYLFLTLAAR